MATQGEPHPEPWEPLLLPPAPLIGTPWGREGGQAGGSGFVAQVLTAG